MFNPNIDTPTKLGFDVASIMVLLMTVTEVLTPLTIILTFAWTIVRLWETDTVQRLFGRKLEGRRKEDTGSE